MTIKKVRTSTKAKVEATAKAAPTRVIRTTGKKAAATRPAVGLFFFHKIPQGNMLRAYMLGLIVAQNGAVKAGATVRVWPTANLKGHLDKQNIAKVEKDTYRLTAAGAATFAESLEKIGADNVNEMVKAVKTGVAPAFYPYPLSTMQKPAA